MSYNGSGTFVINSTGQPVVTGTVISSSTFNAFTADIGTGLSTAITKNGQTTTTALIPFAFGISAAVSSSFAAGTVAAPSIYLATDTGTGFYRIGANNNGYSVSGTKLLDFSSALLAITGAATVSTTLGVTGATTLSSALTYGGVTLANAVTGTGNMVLSASPTLTGTLTAAAISASGTITTGSGGGTSAGLISGYYGASGYGAIWSTGVTPSTSNYSFLTNGTSSTVINAPTSVTLSVANVDKVTITSAGMNGVLGGTTPAAASVTTLTASGLVTGNAGAVFNWAGGTGVTFNRTDGAGFILLNKSNGVNGVNLGTTSLGALQVYTGAANTLVADFSTTGASITGTLGVTRSGAGDTITFGNGTGGGFLYAANTLAGLFWGAGSTSSGVQITGTAATLLSPNQTQAVSVSNTGTDITGTLGVTGVTTIGGNAATNNIAIINATQGATMQWQEAGTAKLYVTAGAGFNAFSLGDIGMGSTGSLKLAGSNAIAVTIANGTSTGMRFNGYGAGALTTDASGNITATSDESIKTEIRPFIAGIAELALINPILHGYTKESGLDTKRNDYAGFSAQNVLAAIPQAVGKSSDGRLSLNDRPILAAAVNALKSHEFAVVKLVAEVQSLRSRVALLERN